MAILLSFVTAVTLHSAQVFSFSLKHRFVTTSEYPAGRVCAHDLDLDGDDEIVLFASSDPVNYVIFRDYLRSERGWRDVGQVNFEHPGFLNGEFLGDLTGDGYADVFVVWQAADDTFWIDCYASALGEFPDGRCLQLGPFLQGCERGPENKVGLVSLFACSDINQDGTSEIIVFSYPFRPGVQPRRIFAFDSSTGREIWSHDTAAVLGEYAYVPGRAGAEGSLVFASYAPDNGFDVDGTTDAASYVFCLSPSGELRWRNEYKGAFSSANIAASDLDGDGTAELIVSRVRSPNSADRNSPNLLVLDPATGDVLRSHVFRPGLRKCVAGRLNSQRKPVICCDATDRSLCCTDFDLRVLWTVRGAENGFGGIIDIADLDADGDCEILAQSSSAVYALDRNGKTLAQAATGAHIASAALASVGGRDLTVVAAGGVMTVLELRSPDLSRTVLSATAGGMTLLLVGLGTYLKVRRKRPHLISDRHAELLDAMTAFGHAGGSLRIIDRLRFHLQNWDRWAGGDTPVATNFAELVDEFEQSVQPDLLEVASLARRAGVESSVWKPLEESSHRAATELEILLKSSAKERVERAVSHLSEVDKRLETVRGYLRRHYSTPLRTSVERVVARRRHELRGIGATVAVSGLNDESSSVFCSGVALEKILDGVVDNAIHAMAGAAQRSLAIEVKQEGDHYLVDVCDTGCGIAQSDWERIFDREYTTKLTGGFGLYYARKELARFSGRIFVAGSAVGEGTTIRVVMRSA